MLAIAVLAVMARAKYLLCQSQHRNYRDRAMVAMVAVLCGLVLSGCVTTGGSDKGVNIPKALKTHIQLGLGYLQQKNRDLARHHFNRALDLDRRSPGAHNGMALLYQLENESALAEKHFRRAVSSDRNFSQAQNNYGSFLYTRKRYKEAYKVFERASKDLEYNLRPSTLAKLGRTALKLGKTARAKSAFEHALSLNNRLPTALIELADLSFQEKDFARSKKFLDQFSVVTKATPRSLWLGIRIERIFENKDKEASYAIALRNLYPYSKENLEYTKTIGSK